MEYSKELYDIAKAIQNYVEKHNYDCYVNLSIGAFDENQELYDDRFWLLGSKDVLKIANEALEEEIENLEF